MTEVTLRRLRGVMVAVLAGLSACSPLPGRSLDPVYLKLGFSPMTAPAPTVAMPPSPVGPSVWVGRYRDSRGEGAISFALVRTESTLAGTWKRQPGAGGQFQATRNPEQRRLTLHMSSAPECPGAFEGWVEVSDSAMVGGYQGADCEGVVADGRFDARPQ